MKVLVLQHIEIETPGLLEDLMRRKGIGFDFVHGYKGESYPEEIDSYSGFIVMGGPMGVYEEDQCPFLKKEKAFLQRVLKTEKPVLGICLGSQLLASVLGAEVKPGLQKEIGWYPVSLNKAAESDSLLQGVSDSFVALHWHGDQFELPDGAICLASSELTQNQAFRYKENVYAFLFHMEVTPVMLPIWVDRFGDELKEASLDGTHILKQAQTYLPPLNRLAEPIFLNWLNLL